MPRRCKIDGANDEGLNASLRIALGRLHDLVLLLEPARTRGGEVNDFLVVEEGVGSAGLLGMAPDSLRGAALSACSWVTLSGEDYAYEDDYCPRDGTSMRYAFRMTALPGRLLLTADNVTADRLERAHLERFAALVDHGRSLVGFITPDLARFYVNPAGRRLTGIEDDDPHLFLSRLPDAFRRQLREQIIPDLVVRGYWSGETRIRHFLTRQQMVLELNCFAVHDRSTGRLLCHAAIARDITAVKRASRELVRHSREVEAARLRIERQAAQLAEQAEELMRARDVAEEATRAKSAFLACMSHEVRTPLTAILGFAEELHAEQGADPTRLEALEAIRRNGEHLLRIINDILDLSSIEAGKLPVSPTAFSPAELVRETVELLRPPATERGLRIPVNFAAGLPAFVRTDPTRVRQVLLNLLSNALKFTEQGEVRLDVAREGSLLQFNVTDTGIGIDAEHASFLFEPFFQADGTTSRKYGGTGLGLAISRRISRLLGGDLVLVRSGPGVGSQFRFTVPLIEVVGQEHLPSLRKPLPAESNGQGRAEGALAGRRILVVDDGRDNRLLLSRMLGKLGAEVVCAGDGREGVEAVLAAEHEGKPFDHVLMDMQMPVVDGFAAVTELRLRGVTRPIIALTANAMPGTRERCLAAGCQEYLIKPIDRSSLLALLLDRGGSIDQ
jgi:signal transduction histidine kinase/ActR/RegA family two-component response regulator